MLGFTTCTHVPFETEAKLEGTHATSKATQQASDVVIMVKVGQERSGTKEELDRGLQNAEY